MAGAPAARGWRTLLVVAALVTLTDYATKSLVRSHIPPGDAYSVIPGCFDLVHGHNTGIVFGLFQGWPSFFTVMNLVYVPFLVWGYVALPLSRGGRVAWAAILGGCLGNLIDRLTLGHVTDFIDWYIGPYHWYTFNVADACLTVGVLAIAGLNLFHTPPPAEPAADASDSA